MRTIEQYREYIGECLKVCGYACPEGTYVLERLGELLDGMKGIPLDRLTEICNAEREGNLEIVVRCKDCRQNYDCGRGSFDYCSDGEAREAAEAKGESHVEKS